MTPNTQTSPVHALLARLVELGPRAHVVLNALAADLPRHELAALAYAWGGAWARPSQVIPSGDWRSCGFMTGRGWGKTASCVSFALQEIEAGRARRLALIGQSEAKTVEILVRGETGFLELCPSWLGCEWESSSNRVLFGNGAHATVYTAQEPNGLRGPQHDLALATEIASWPPATRLEAFENLKLGLRLAYGKLLWDSMPKRRNPLIRQMLDAHAKDPAKHLIVRGSTLENAINLSRGAVAEWYAAWVGTAKGREELEGEWLEDSEACLVKQPWIDDARRNAPDKYVRRVLGIDPAVTRHAGSDRTGLVEVGSGVDGQVYVIGDYSGKHEAPVWGALVVDTYLRNGIDYVVAETNKGGDLVTVNLRAVAQSRGLSVVVVGAEERPERRAGTLFVKQVFARGAKEDRAQPLATAYERRRISHVIGADLAELEDVLTTWEPRAGQRSPDALDALVHAAVELLGLSENKPDPSLGFKGIEEAAKQLLAPVESPGLAQITHALGGWGRGDRI